MTILKKSFFTALLLFFLNPVFSQDQDKQLGTVYQINRSNQEIVVASPRAGLLFKMGDLVYVPTDDKNVILTVTFPMQTVARCKIAKSHQKYGDEIKKGMPVFRYIPGDTLNSLQKDFERIDEIRLYNGRIIRGAIISRDGEFLILTPTGKIKINENQIKNIRIIR
ncbi:MAG TPA: hypothetical protein PK926_01880 [Spirochaetota bacterium]|nr:hypothetical protein [Spirochaetota bacterium]HPI90202.1 hypothetical protein [Spirochaetota bacterium]HPR46522.1 hypothetical protein [Spirochaetota bacterium]